MTKGRPDPHSWALKAGDAQTAVLTTVFEGKRPCPIPIISCYSPMRKQGAILLGIGGDNSNGGVGTFYEGVLTAGYSSDAADEAVAANIAAAGYKRPA